MRRAAEVFNICGGRQKLLIYVEVKAENTIGPYNEGRPSAAPHQMVAAAEGESLHGPLVFSALASTYIKSF